MTGASHQFVTPPDRRRLAPGGGRRRGRAGGFTLVEVLATILMISIVLPVVMQGVSLATNAAGAARRRNEATALAQMKLAELAATGQWLEGNLDGDFGTDWPDYRWTASVQAWTTETTATNIEQLDLVVSRVDGNNNDIPVVTLSTLVFQSTSATGTTAGGT